MKTGPVQSTSELYPNPNLTLTISTAKKWGAFNKIKQALSQKGVKLRLLFPARLQVWEWNFYFWDTGGHACILQQASDETRIKAQYGVPSCHPGLGFSSIFNQMRLSAAATVSYTMVLLFCGHLKLGVMETGKRMISYHASGEMYMDFLCFALLLWGLAYL